MAELRALIVFPEQKEVEEVKGTEKRTKFAKHLIKSGVYKPTDLVQITLTSNKIEKNKTKTKRTKDDGRVE